MDSALAPPCVETSGSGKGSSADRSDQAKPQLALWWPFLCLLLVEVVAFGVNLKRIGAYQDEWITFGQLQFLPHTAPQIFSAFILDGRKIVRPAEIIYFPLLFYLVGTKPLWYHVVSYACEFLGGWFLFLFLSRLTGDRAVALAAAVLFLVYPTHDSTHYVIVAHSAQIAASFFLLSLWLFLKGLEEGRPPLIAWSTFSCFLSIFMWEECLPLIALYPVIVFLKQAPDERLRKWKKLLAWTFPFFAVAAAQIIYRFWLMPASRMAHDYVKVIDPAHFLAVICAGINCSLSPYMLSFCFGMAGDALNDGLSFFYLALLGAAAISMFAVLSRPSCKTAPQASSNASLVMIGVVTLLLAYTIFGVSKEHTPVIDAWLNRVNVGGSLGASLIIAGCFGILRDLWKPGRLNGRVTFALAISLLASFFILVDWQFAKPWIISWQAQKELMDVLRSHKYQIKSGDSIIVGGLTRFVRWAPVADGVWDFQNILQTTLGNPNVHGNVLTERLRMSDEALVDKWQGYLLGVYPFKRMILYVPQQGQWIPISSRKEFIRELRRYGFSVPPGAEVSQPPHKLAG